MRFTAPIPLGLALLMALLGSAQAAELKTYIYSQGCGGTFFSCTNAGPGVCCRLTSFDFTRLGSYSFACAGCPANNFYHGLFHGPDPESRCRYYMRGSSTAHPNCLTFKLHSGMTSPMGHRYWANCANPSARGLGGGEEPPCDDERFPDKAVVDGHAFNITGLPEKEVVELLTSGEIGDTERLFNKYAALEIENIDEGEEQDEPLAFA